MNDVRGRYIADTVQTATPARLLTMLYDRLLLDLDRGAAAMLTGDRAGGGAHVSHACDIVAELIGSLDADAWDGGPALLGVYRYLQTQLVRAGAQGDATVVTECRDLVEPLAQAWHTAARSAAAPVPAPVPVGAPAGAGPLEPGLLGVG
jgi:flagellar protein FliS